MFLPRFKIEIHIKERFKKHALRSINNLFTFKSLKKHLSSKETHYSYDGSSSIKSPKISNLKTARKYLRYKWIDNPTKEEGYETLKEAFRAFRYIDSDEMIIDEEGKDFVYQGRYHGVGYIRNNCHDKLFFDAIAPYCKDWKCKFGGSSCYTDVYLEVVEGLFFMVDKGSRNNGTFEKHQQKVTKRRKERKKRIIDSYFTFLLICNYREDSVAYGIPLDVVRYVIFPFYFDMNMYDWMKRKVLGSV